LATLDRVDSCLPLTPCKCNDSTHDVNIFTIFFSQHLTHITHRIAMAPTAIEGAPAPLVWINGYPGTGKLTVAKAMAAFSPQVVVLDNHQLIDPVEARFSRSHPRYREERRIYRTYTLAHYASDPSLFSYIIVCTGKVLCSESARSISSLLLTSGRFPVG
jgi:hypothetical protein